MADPAPSEAPSVEPAWYTTLKERILARADSERTPYINTSSNTADQIERYMQADNHRKWGFVIYRSTYESEEDWEEFMRRFHSRTKETLECYNGLDLLDSLEVTVLADQSLFDGASTDTIRQHFQRWVVDTWKSEQQPPITEQDTARKPISMGTSARYRYALQADQEVLHSVLHESVAPPDYDIKKRGWIKLIDKSWYYGRTGAWDESDSVNCTPIEGMTFADVGWMMIDFQAVVNYYEQCCNFNFWVINYARPPRVLGRRQLTNQD